MLYLLIVVEEGLIITLKSLLYLRGYKKMVAEGLRRPFIK